MSLNNDIINRVITGDTSLYLYSSDLGLTFSAILPTISVNETCIIAKKISDDSRVFMYFPEKEMSFGSRSVISYEKDAMADFFMNFLNEERKLNIEKNDDFYNIIIKSVCGLNLEIIDNHINPEKNIEYYKNKCKEFFISIPSDVYGEDITDEERLDYLKGLVENQFSLDNLTKSGIRSYYESIGYSNVRVKYDKDTKDLKIYGDGNTVNRNLAAVMKNGEVNINDILFEGESIESINEIYSILPDGSKNTIYSKSDIINSIINDEDEAENIKNGMISIQDGKIYIKNAMLSLGVLSKVPGVEDDPNEVYLRLFKSDFYDNTRKIEYLSFLVISVMKRLNEEIEKINKKYTDFSNDFSVVNSSIKLKSTDIENLKSGISSLVIRCKNINEKIGNINSQIEDLNTKKFEIQTIVENYLSEDEVKEYTNNIAIITSELEEYERRVNSYAK